MKRRKSNPPCTISYGKEIEKNIRTTRHEWEPRYVDRTKRKQHSSGSYFVDRATGKQYESGSWLIVANLHT